MYNVFTTNQPIYCPWQYDSRFKEEFSACDRTVVSSDRCFIIWKLLHHVLSSRIPGNIWECGVYKGGTAKLMAAVLRQCADKRLYLFDTFEGMPKSRPEKGDKHKLGDFSDTNLESVKAYLGETSVSFCPGIIPTTFEPFRDAVIAMVHIDVDLYSSVFDSTAFVYPRLASGGVIIYDDYGFPFCASAKTAVDDFFGKERGAVPIPLPTGQALVLKP